MTESALAIRRAEARAKVLRHREAVRAGPGYQPEPPGPTPRASATEVLRQGRQCRGLNPGWREVVRTGLVKNVLQAASILLSGHVPEEVLTFRNEACIGDVPCEHLTVTTRGGKVLKRCVCCACPNLHVGDIREKNKHKKFACAAEEPRFGQWDEHAPGPAGYVKELTEGGQD